MSRVTIDVNGLSMVHEDSGGVSAATLPDVCSTPPSLAPVPYPNVARSRDLVGGSSMVRADGGRKIALAGSAFGRSTGDEPGLAGGVTSGVHGKEAVFLTHSSDVLIEGRGVARLTDKMLHNRGNTIDCAGVLQAVVARGADDRHDDAGHRARGHEETPLWGTPLSPPRRGVDTNCTTLNTAYATHRRHINFVCRYISGFSEAEATAANVTPTPNNMRLTRGEAEGLGMDIVAIWEEDALNPNIGPNSRPISMTSLDAQFDLGHDDGLKAASNLHDAGGGGHPIYFTVDCLITEKLWFTQVDNPAAEPGVTNGQLITKYFEGIKKALGHDVGRIGVYGRYTTVKRLMEAGLARYGWQMTFNHPPYAPAHIHQTSIFPDLTRWGPPVPRALIPALKNSDVLAQITDQDQLNLLHKSQMKYQLGLRHHWQVSGAGGLDFDRAVKVDFGQWRPGEPGLPSRK